MAIITKLSAFISLLVFFAHLLSLSSTTQAEPTVLASPGVSPYVTAPDIYPFFPNPSADGPMSFAAPPQAERPVLAPSSGDFVGIKSSTSARLDSTAAIVFALLSSFLVTGT
ncbi:hypothetical protein L6164_004902 [Bauhinia variegata]|uniref:Uncharacterized protein n=1 Tax=Bauhinia variegata TaxID=167791 RepID=A0ACB9PRS2_BAUVA|nr:hypothetical protein L6164_004902 [Bauhinia variegata]